jgi:hypothetical protein
LLLTVVEQALKLLDQGVVTRSEAIKAWSPFQSGRRPAGASQSLS